jgi:hypothetical protein
LSNQHAFLAIIAYYVSNDGELGLSFISSLNCFTHLHAVTEELPIDFQELIGEHSGENMAEAIWATMELYGLIRKVSFWASVHQCTS